MQIRAEQIEKTLERGIAPVYLLFGDEPFLVQQALDQLRAALRNAGFDERIRLVQDKTFQWAELRNQGQTQSLFSSQQLIELELPDASPGKEGGAALNEFLEHQSPDQVLLIHGPKITKQSQGTKWFKSLEKVGVFVPIYAPSKDQLPAYVRQRASHHGVNLAPDAVDLLSLWFEGNLLALDQELMKLSLQQEGREHPWHATDLEAASSDQSRYDIFMLRDALVAGELQRYLHCLERLHETGTEPVLMLWTLSKLQQALDAMARAIGQQQPLNTIFRNERIWPQQQGNYERLARQYSLPLNAQLVTLLERAEYSIKRESGESTMVLFAHFGIALLRPNQRENLLPFCHATPNFNSMYAG
ncbi:MAG: DNA polymerase III subunit delta [Idiomarina sp.]|nr:DNA polymerase III subunit delta [Idiomarina sp.]